MGFEKCHQTWSSADWNGSLLILASNNGSLLQMAIYRHRREVHSHLMRHLERLRRGNKLGTKFGEMNFAAGNEDILRKVAQKNKQNVFFSRSFHASSAILVINKQDVMFPALPLVRAGMSVLF